MEQQPWGNHVRARVTYDGVYQEEEGGMNILIWNGIEHTSLLLHRLLFSKTDNMPINFIFDVRIRHLVTEVNFAGQVFFVFRPG